MEKASWEENGIKPYFFSKRLFFIGHRCCRWQEGIVRESDDPAYK